MLTGGEVAVACLAAHGVEVVFGIPGTHNLPLYAQLERHGIRHVLPRHEQGAGYAADGYARASGRPGVAITTAGPALMNAAAAAGQAQSDSVPLLILAPGMPRAHPAASSGYLHEMPSQQRAMSGVVARSVRVMSHAELASELAAAFTAFRTERPRARYVEVPLDLLAEEAEVVVPEPQHAGPPAPAPAAMAAAVELLRGAARPAIVAGGGAAGAADALRDVAERIGAPVITTANGKGTLPEDHPLSLGARLNLPAARAWLEGCDVVLAVGTELGESDIWGPPLALSGALIRVDIDALQAHANHVSTVAVIGDAAPALAALADASEGAVTAAGDAAPDASGAATPQVGGSAGPSVAADVRARLDAEHRAQAGPWLDWLAALRGALPDDAIVVGDSAMCCYYGALGGLPVRRPRSFLYPTGFGTLGYAVPAAIGAQLGAPDRPVLALSGDGGLMFTVAELASAAALQLPLPVVVFVNDGYGEIRNEMADGGFAPVGVDFPPPDLPALARALGCAGDAVQEPDALPAAVSAAFERAMPTLIAVPEARR
jgi:thiamine pyrophosphate-dependent acetolactate synthase large subunit-like protein